MMDPTQLDRDRFRAYPLDGALLWFQPSSGRTVRVQNERTRHLARRAPRVVMFGITNRLDGLGRALSSALGTSVTPELERNDHARVVVTTTEPARVLRALASAAEDVGAQLAPWVSEVDAMPHVLRR
jgi:hypothetical protein